MNINKLITMLITEKGYKNKKKEISRNKKIKHNNLKTKEKIIMKSRRNRTWTTIKYSNVNSQQ